MGQQVNVYRELKFFPGAIITGMPGLGEGTTYYVNNITGSSTADGLSWNSCVKEASDAITLSDASRLIHPGGEDNSYIRNTIVIQGTETAYAGITHLASYCRMIGLGANPYGNGQGIPRLGADNITTAAGGGMTGTGDTGDVRGAYISGIQWQCNDTTDCFQVRNIYRTTIEDCAFFTAGNAVGNTFNGIEITGNAGGLVVRDSHWGTNASRTAMMWHGFNITGTYFNNCLVEDCTIGGRDAGIWVASSVTYGQGSVFKNCYIGDLGHGACAVGILDQAGTGTVSYWNCMINAEDPIQISNDNSRAVGCVAGTAFIAS